MRCNVFTVLKLFDIRFPLRRKINLNDENEMSPNPKRFKQTHLFNVPPTHVTGVVAIVYSWTFNPPFDHVLKGCSYFGKTKQTFETRTRQHKYDAIRNLTELGLHALWRQYPHDDHWLIRLLDTRHFVDPVEAHAWMNEEEMKLIDAHGGVLRDMDKTLKQTLNLTRGGQGDPRTVWDAIMAGSRRRLSKVWPKFEHWYEDKKHLRVPTMNPNLGKIVTNIRSRNDFLHHADFAMWLWCACFKMHTRDSRKNCERWTRVFAST